eukprot:gnl/Chilomastix_caulleri/1021.p6 GENE.gnl/Chilomastix_caulleri/1021~~gnl/Chilomastix_caulleri/1021.p6  ORF type:complete len:61 (-),score=24.59 gnl/Chilomastix_caulleri/1021:1005-1187(-)
MSGTTTYLAFFFDALDNSAACCIAVGVCGYISSSLLTGEGGEFLWAIGVTGMGLSNTKLY